MSMDLSSGGDSSVSDEKQSALAPTATKMVQMKEMI
jgi:hypothetical protein